ncbi:FRG1-like family-domain-containing protein [Pyronema domesticum]|uniref:Similar to Uncharacterized protein P23A10.12 acc. no. Q9P7X3 n=1 Tax=Pyronema omphalodes (strain CBS 100304) TaxID=1076935 RepID=U4LN77_PYROM|nr:FRG1-like family-domain-containing protein [Pyronema domesticum]CCX15870.1 Similar to Uncharacterized protein P23A10.12; acc. no. Q9P7X3 [Pyronema omphalodes CBS 100304]
MVSALRFKGEKKKKRKRAVDDGDDTSAEPSAKAPKKAYDEDIEGWADAEVLEDLTGPIMLTLASNPPVALAADAAGSVFCSPLTLITGEDLSTAEPSDVQQVWICAKVYGSSIKYSLKSHLGKYLSCDKTGVLTATREAISAEEEFVPVRRDGRWAWTTVREKFLGVEETSKGVQVRGDRDDVGFREGWTVRLQKRNKVKVKEGASEEKGRVKDRVSRKELEELAGVPLDDDQVKMLRRAKREGGFHEALLDVRVKHGKHDKFAY